jgi:hypothetical protein
MSKFDDMARIRVNGIISGLVLGSAIGAYLAFAHGNIAIWLAAVMALPTARLLIIEHKRGLYKRAARSNEAPRLAVFSHWFLFVSQFIYAMGISSAIVGLIGTTVDCVSFRLPGKYVNLMAFAVLPVGYAAHRFKKQNQLRYGVVEVLTGMATAIGATARTEFQPTQALAIIGAIYVVARGFNNISDARPKAVATSPVAPTAPLPS